MKGKLKNPVERILSNQPFLVLDGALATELEKRGADLNDPLWSAAILIRAPQLISEVYSHYLRAGADLITTATYQASFKGFEQKGIDRQEALNLFALSVELARSVREAFWAKPSNRVQRQFPLIAASLGPFGAHLADGSEYRGDYRLAFDELIDWYRPQVKVLSAQEGVDLLLFETIPSLLEARAIASLMEEFPAQVFGLSFSCRDGRHISHGESFADAVEKLSDHPQMIAIGINCTAPAFVSPLLKSARGKSQVPLMVYPNSGEIWDTGRHCWVENEQAAYSFRQMAEEWYSNGAKMIGGCCRTGPEQIREIRAVMSGLIESL